MGSSYTEIKENTIKWCKNLKKEGIYTEKDYQDCENNFRNLSLGEIPQDMQKGKDRIENSYSLYGRTSDFLEDKLSGNKSQIALETNNGLRMVCQKDGTVSLSNPNTISNLKESYWRLIPQKENQYLILSNYAKYLSVDENKRISANRTEISPQSIWVIERNNGHLTIESFHHTGYKLSFNNKDIVLLGGFSESQNWKLKPIYSADSSIIKLFDDSELITLKKKHMTLIKNSLQEKYKTLLEYLFVNQLILEIKDILIIFLRNANKRVERINKNYDILKKKIFQNENKCLKYKTVETEPCQTINVPIFFFFRTKFRKERRCKKVKKCDRFRGLTSFDRNKLEKYFEDIDNYEAKIAFTSSEILDYKKSVREEIDKQIEDLEKKKNILEAKFEKEHQIFLDNDKLIQKILDKLMKDILDSESKINNNNLKLKSLADEHRDIIKKNNEIDIHFKEIKRKTDLTEVNKDIVLKHSNFQYYEYYICLIILIISIIVIGYLIRSFIS